jgi:hypothetical protein
MNVTLLDEQGSELTEIRSHLGRSSGQMLVDWATRPDALFHHYFDRGSRTVTAVIGAATWTAQLGTRWKMGARFWFLHGFRPEWDAPVRRIEPSRVVREPAPAADRRRHAARHRGDRIDASSWRSDETGGAKS